MTVARVGFLSDLAVYAVYCAAVAWVWGQVRVFRARRAHPARGRQ